MNPEQIGDLLRALIVDYYTLDGTELAENAAGRAPNFHEWVLRHALTQMLLRSEPFSAADSRRGSDQVALLALPEYTEWTDANAVHIRMRLIVRTGETSELRVYATLSGGRRGVSISSERSAAQSAPAVARGAVMGEWLPPAARHIHRAPAHRTPAPGNGIARHYQ
jgi:hypothetical protein